MGLYQNVHEDVNSNAFVNLNDSAGTGITSTNVGGKQGLDVNLINSIMIGEPDKSTYVYGTSDFQPVGGVFQDTSPTLTAGQSGSFRLTANRGLHINLRNSSGAELGDSNADGLWVKPGDGTNAQAYSATSEAFVQLRQGGNVANVTASNELKVIETNSGLILALMKPSTATITSVALAVTSSVALASNAARKGMSFFNDSAQVIWLAFAATATTAAYTVKMQAGSYWEGMDSRVYTGIVSVIAGSASGNLVVTELT